MANIVRTNTEAEVAAALRGGAAAIFPTETVYGIGVSVRDAESPQVLFDLKRRPSGKPIAWLVGSPADLDRYGADVPTFARALVQAFWPGPLTLIVRASDAVPAAFRSAAGTIGLRMPGNACALSLISQVGCPLATTSANLSGAPAPRSLAALDKAFAREVGTVLADAADADDAGKSGVASTIVDCTGPRPTIVREGALTGADIEKACAFAAERSVTAAHSADAPQPAPGTFAVTEERVSFPSADGSSTVRGLLWLPAAEGASAPTPRAVLQLEHGMAEHVGRYREFARFLAAHGFAVCAADHIGHGATAACAEALGDLPVDGKRILLADVHELRIRMQRRFPGAPYLMFGHSMGSFIVRAYLARHGAGLAAAVLCGTGQQPFLLSKGGNLLARLLAATRGRGYRSVFVDGLGAGAFAKQIPHACTPFDWISTDPAVVDAYAADPQCGFMFSVGGYATLTDLTAEVVTRACAARVPKALPVLLIAGAEDPVGACGKGVRAAAAQLRRAGVRRVDVRLYPGMRHEILNEPGRARVYAETLEWMEDRLCAARTS